VPQADNTPPELDVVIKTTNESHEPLSGASVWVLTADSASPIGKTSEEGLLTVPRHVVTGERMICWHDEYEPVSTLLPRDLPPLIDVTLAMGRTISGVVAWDEGSGSVDGVEVFAFRDGYPPSREDIRFVRKGPQLPSFRHAVVEPNGQFRISGLRATDRYTITAAGNGAIASDRIPSQYPGTSSVRMGISPLFGVVIHIYGPNRTLIRTGNNVFGDSGWRSTVTGIQNVLVPGLEFYLNADEADWDIKSVGVTEQSLFFKGGPASRKRVPVVYNVRLPGYSSMRTEIGADLIRGRVTSTDLILESQATDWGELIVKYIGFASGIGPRASYGSPFGMIEMRDENHQITYLPVGEPIQETRISGIPFGSYDAVFSTSDWNQTYPQGGAFRVVINGSPATLALNLDDVGAALFNVKAANGNPYRGALDLQVTQPSNSMLRAFEHAPYVLEGLPSGNYHVQAIVNGSLFRMRSEQIPFTALAGSLISVDLTASEQE
jgi:hypothetical protein